jgi:putative tryptophan/tyrosine transport system substrate-binding protein
MSRRSLLLATGATTLASALGGSFAFAQAAREPRRIGVLTVSNAANYGSSLQALRDGLRERGFVEGGDIVIDIRYANGRAQDLPRLDGELAALRPAVIIAPGSTAANAALAATAADVPVVSLGDLVGAGHAAQLGHPGGRVTGVSFLPTPLNAKRLELLAGLLPKGSAVLDLGDPLARDGDMQVVDDAGRSLGLVTHAAYARLPAEIETAFVSARRLRVAGLNVLNSPYLAANRLQIFELAAGAKLPAIYQWPEFAADGGLMGYGPSIRTMFRQLAGYASRLLNGAKPADLPIEQPTRFALVINLKAAKAIGVTIPQSLLLRADEVID